MFIARISFIAALLTASTTFAADYTITLKDKKFVPQNLEIPADTKVQIEIVNEDSSPIEFESRELKREKVISPKSKALINIGPLKAGTYPYVDEFHEDDSKGVITAK